MTWQLTVAAALVAVGAFLIGVAAVGLVRLPDLYNRTNAVTKAASLGVVLVLLGVVVVIPGPTAFITLLVAIVLQLFTVPIAGFAIGRAAYLSKAPFARGTRREDR